MRLALVDIEHSEKSPQRRWKDSNGKRKMRFGTVDYQDMITTTSKLIKMRKVLNVEWEMLEEAEGTSGDTGAESWQ
jgi:hypothetical protein